MAQANAVILQLKVVLRGTRPPIWRRVLVPSTVTLDRFHHILQTVMGWTDSHLHEFRTGEGRYGTPDPDWDEDDEVAPERRVRLGQLLQRPKDRLAYADANSIEAALTHERKTLGSIGSSKSAS
jgi:hypothetical protein